MASLLQMAQAASLGSIAALPEVMVSTRVLITALVSTLSRRRRASKEFGADGSTGGGIGVAGYSNNGSGVYGQSSGEGYTHAGVVGSNIHGAGIGFGVTGIAAACGVYGQANGFSGLSDEFAGVIGESNLVPGVLGVSSAADGVHAITSADGNSGVAALDTSSGGGHGLYASSDAGIGVSASGGFAPLLLAPSSAAGAPTTGTHQTGEVYVDSNGVFWGCVAGGTPGTWYSMVQPLIPVNPPLRAYDSRTSEGGPGPLPEDATSAHISLTSAGVPAGASAALINLTIVNTVDAGFLALFEAGGAIPGTSNIDWYQSGQILANNATVSLSADGALQVHSGGLAGAETDYIIDVFGYYP